MRFMRLMGLMMGLGLAGLLAGQMTRATAEAADQAATTNAAAPATNATAQSAGAAAQSGVAPVPAKAVPLVVLDSRSFWRMFQVLKPPAIQGDGKLEPLLQQRGGLDTDSPEPPADWFTPEFDDQAWPRRAALAAARTPYLARLCLRGKFKVTDPAKAGDLQLRLSFHGGAIVYLNGKEVARTHTGGGGDGAMAEAYPREAFVDESGKVFIENGRNQNSKESRRRTGLWQRNVGEVVIPQSALRPGLNVLAVELVRAPYDKVVNEKKVTEDKWSRVDLGWGTCEFGDLRLTAGPAAAEGLAANVARPAGLQVWNQDLLVSDYDQDYGDPNEPLRPVRIVAAGNGTFSGKFVIGSTAAIVELAVTVSDLVDRQRSGGRGSAADTIPAAAVKVRYAVPWLSEHLVVPYTGQPSPYRGEATLLGQLVETAPPEIPVAKVVKNRYEPADDPAVAAVPGAVASVWLTVKVPAEARGGTYVGQATVRVKGEVPLVVPIEVRVADWRLPAPHDYRTWVEMIQSPDTLQVEYGLERWSERHWQMISRSLEFLAEVGSHVVYVPLIAQTNAGNAESMVRWIDKGGGKYEYDFSIMERYLDLATQKLGQPVLVIFEVWEVYVIDKAKYAGTGYAQEARAIQHLEDNKAEIGGGPIVTIFDPATKKSANAELPHYSQPASKALWQPLFDELKSRMAKRGLASAMSLGTLTDARPTKVEFAFFKELTGDLPWVSHAHHGAPTDLAKIAYQTRVWNIDFNVGPLGKNRYYGWKEKGLLADYERHSEINYLPTTMWRHMCEFNITGGQRGVGRLGADYWFAVRDKKGNRHGTVGGRYPQSSRRNLDLYASVLAPGPDGPVATTRYEIFREGLEESEARIYLERILTDPERRGRLGEELAAQCQAALDERLAFMWRGLGTLQITGPGWAYLNWRGSPSVAGHSYFVCSGWQARTEKLFAMAAAVGRKLGE